MRNHKLLDFLAQLPAKDIKSFKKHIVGKFSEAHNLYKLYAYIIQYYPRFINRNLDAEKIRLKVFGDKTFNEKFLSNEFSKIWNELKKFLILEHQNDFPFEKNMILLQLFKKFNQEKRFNDQLKSLEKELDEESLIDMWYWLKQMKIADMYYFDSKKEQINIGSDKLEKAMEYLDMFYAAAKLKYSSELYNRYQVIQSSELEIQFLERIEAIDWESKSLFHHYYKMALQMIKERNDSLFYQLKKLFFKNSIKFNKDDQYILITYLLNHTSNSVRKGKLGFEKESFELLQYGAANGMFIIEGFFNPSHFLNAVDVAGKLEDFNWATEFIERNGKELRGSLREYYTKFCLALIEYRRNNFERCSSLLVDITSQNPLEELRVRWLELVSHVELNNTILVFNKCASFEKFIRRNKIINDNHKTSVLLSIRIIRQLLNLEPDKSKLKKELNNAHDFYYKSWLLKKIDEL